MAALLSPHQGKHAMTRRRHPTRARPDLSFASLPTLMLYWAEGCKGKNKSSLVSESCQLEKTWVGAGRMARFFVTRDLLIGAENRSEIDEPSGGSGAFTFALD